MSDPKLAADATLVDSTLGATPRHSTPPAAASRWAIHLGRIFYTHNPFYVASAWLVFSGLRTSFPVSSGSIDVWA